MSQILNRSGYPLITCRVRKWGNSHVICVPSAVLERMGMINGSYVAMRIAEPYATFTVWAPPRVPDPKGLPVEMLPLPMEDARRHG